jgi:hypothetical protein
MAWTELRRRLLFPGSGSCAGCTWKAHNYFSCGVGKTPWERPVSCSTRRVLTHGCIKHVFPLHIPSLAAKMCWRHESVCYPQNVLCCCRHSLRSGYQNWYSVEAALSFPSSKPYTKCVVRVPGYRSRGPGFDSWCYQIFLEVVGLERGPPSLVSTIEELLGKKSSGSGLESREYGRRDPSRWPCGTLYPQTLALTSPTSGGRSIGIVRSRTQTTEFSFSLGIRCVS